MKILLIHIMLNPAQKTQVYQIMIGRCMNLPAGHTTNEKLFKVLIPDFIELNCTAS